MGSTAKHQAIENDSALPNEIRCHILSFLTTVDAVRTTVLSTRWKDMWTSLSNLDFDDKRDFFNARPRDQYYTNPFTTFVERVLLLRDSSDISRFRLAISHADGMYCAHIEDWICTELQRKVAELDLDLPDGVFFHVPQSLFMCKTLKVLKDGANVVCSFHLPTYKSFPSLKFLRNDVEDQKHPPTYKSFPSLKFLRNDVEDQKHGCYCPFIEDLTVIPIAIYKDEGFNLCAPELKTLRISLERLEWSHNFCIYAPKLKNICLEEISLSRLSMECRDSLVEASIKFKDLSANEEPYFADSATSVMTTISNVQCLFISAYSLEARYLPVFRNLTKLKLALLESYYCEFLPELLEKTPNLNALALEDKTKYDGSSELRWVSPVVTPLCLKSHLKTISIREFKGRQADIKATIYLRSHGFVLEEMTIYIGGCRMCWKKGGKEDKRVAEE